MKRRFSFRPFSTSPDNGGRMLLDEATWAEVRRLYCEEGASQPMLALKFSISRSSIGTRCRREGWTKGRPERVGRGTRKTYASLPSPKSRRSMIAEGSIGPSKFETRARGATHGERREPVGPGRGARKPCARGHDQEFREGGEVVAGSNRVREPDRRMPQPSAPMRSACAERLRSDLAALQQDGWIAEVLRSLDDASLSSFKRLAALGARRSAAAVGNG